MPHDVPPAPAPQSPHDPQHGPQRVTWAVTDSPAALLEELFSSSATIPLGEAAATALAALRGAMEKHITFTGTARMIEEDFKRGLLAMLVNSPSDHGQDVPHDSASAGKITDVRSKPPMP